MIMAIMPRTAVAGITYRIINAERNILRTQASSKTVVDGKWSYRDNGSAEPLTTLSEIPLGSISVYVLSFNFSDSALNPVVHPPEAT